MKFYDYKEINNSCNCDDVAKSLLGLQLDNDGRCAATWLGGDNPTRITINQDGFHDFKTEEKGSIIDLVAIVKFGGGESAMTQAQEILGEYLNLTPFIQTQDLVTPNQKYQELIADGFVEIKRYHYCDEQNNNVHSVVRFEKETDKGKKKWFMQCTPKGWGLGSVKPILYNLANIIQSDWAIIVEGEKDADSLINLSFPATTICGGSKKWRSEYNEIFANKNVIIFHDNDSVGLAHANLIGSNIIDGAQSVQIIKSSQKEKGDITDYINEGHTSADIATLIKNAPLLTADDFIDVDVLEKISQAKEANKYDLSNYIPLKKEVGNQTKIQKEPRQINDLIKDVHKRFLGFPCKIGEAQLFDHDRKTKRIEYINNVADLFSWLMIKSNRRADWARGENTVTKNELFEGLSRSATRFEAISYVPDFPKRDDIFYAHDQLPAPDADHKYFNDFVDFFKPANELFKVLLKAFITAPLYFEHGIPRPLWIIDSVDGAGTGKTTIVEMVAKLYGAGGTENKGGSPIRTSKQELRTNFSDLVKRIVSSEGRQARLLLVDNVTGNFQSSEFADMITSDSISGKAPYGRGEETRPNNLTYVMTANSASVDNDLATRGYYIQVQRPNYSATWKQDIMQYLQLYRLHILADIIDIIENHKLFNLPPVTRFAEFETKILQPFCKDSEEYSQVIKLLLESKAESNIEEEIAKTIEEVLRHNMVDVASMTTRINPSVDKVFIRSDVVKTWFEKANFELRGDKLIQQIRNLAKGGFINSIDEKARRFPNNGELRRNGLMWNPHKSAGKPRIIGFTGARKIGEIPY